jgi:biotin carboxylase
VRAAGGPPPGWWVVGGDDDPPDVPLPVVVKAPDRQGQKGLSLVEEPEALAPAIATARAAARGGVALVEERVDGPEVTVVGFSHDGAFTPLVVTDRIVAPPPAFGVALAHVWPANVSDTKEVSDTVESALAALGIENGPSYTQLRLHEDGPRVIEVAARLGGGHDAELAQAVTGIDLNGLAIDAALGRVSAPPEPGRLVGGAVTRFLVAPPGILEAVEVPEGLEGVERVRIYREPGYVVVPLRRGSDRAGSVLAVADTREEAVARADAAAAAIVFHTAEEPALAQ